MAEHLAQAIREGLKVRLRAKTRAVTAADRRAITIVGGMGRGVTPDAVGIAGAATAAVMAAEVVTAGATMAADDMEEAIGEMITAAAEIAGATAEMDMVDVGAIGGATPTTACRAERCNGEDTKLAAETTDGDMITAAMGMIMVGMEAGTGKSNL